MGRSPCCDKVGLKKGTWTAEEDRKLLTYVEKHGIGNWRALPAKAGLQRCGKSCRLRWTNYLRPDIKRGKFSLQEEQTVIQLHALLGNRWSAIAAHLPKRTDNEIKNHWNTHLKKRLTKMGIDPATHKPKTIISLSSTQQKLTANLIHMAQWESARLEAESRLVRESKLMSITIPFQNKPTFLPPCLDILKVWQGTWTVNGGTNLSPTSNGALVSPTSTLNFSDNMFTHPNTARFVSNLPSSFPVSNHFENPKTFQVRVTSEQNAPNHDLKCVLKPNNDEQQDVGLEYPNPIDASAAAFVAEHSLRHPNFMEDMADCLPDHCDEDNGKYWNSILDDPASFAYESYAF